jgi:hypothetical protein
LLAFLKHSLQSSNAFSGLCEDVINLASCKAMFILEARKISS